MSHFMIEINLPEFMSDDFIGLIPKQKLFIDSLMKKGMINSYSVSIDYTKLWVNMIVADKNYAKKIVQTFPIANFIDYKIIELTFYNTSAVFIPSMSLN